MQVFYDIIRALLVLILAYNLSIISIAISVKYTAINLVSIVFNDSLLLIIREFIIINLISIIVNVVVNTLMVTCTVIMCIKNNKMLEYTDTIGTCITHICDVNIVWLVSLLPLSEFNLIIAAILILITDQINITIDTVKSTIVPKIQLITQYRDVRNLKNCRHIITEYMISTFQETIIGSLNVAESIILYSSILKTSITEHIKDSISIETDITHNIVVILILQSLISILYTRLINHISRRYLHILSN